MTIWYPNMIESCKRFVFLVGFLQALQQSLLRMNGMDFWHKMVVRCLSPFQSQYRDAH